MQDPLIDKTMEYLFHSKEVNDIEIKRIVLGSYFTVVELSDNSVGAVMSYYDAKYLIEGGLATKIEEAIELDPQLFISEDGFSHSIFAEWKNDPQFLLATGCILSAITSAYSRPFLHSAVNEEFLKLEKFPDIPEVFESASALVIGFGGYLPFLIRETSITDIHVCDLSYKNRYDEMKNLLNIWLEDHPTKKVTIFESFDDHAGENYDLLSITGSSLCNGTLTDILKVHDSSFTILQGQSASIHPKFLFEAGVNMVATTIKPKEIVEDAQKDPSGRTLTKYFERGLPFIFLLPKL